MIVDGFRYPIENDSMSSGSDHAKLQTFRQAAIQRLEHAGDILNHALNQLRYRALADPNKLLWIDPASVSRYNCLFIRKWKGAFVTGAIIDGDWDRVGLPVAEHPVFLGLRERFVDGVPWEQTKLFTNEGYVYLKEGSQSETCLKRDRLYESIKAHGVLPDHPPPPGKKQEGVKNVMVFIGRDGEFIFSCRGWHRLCIAKFLHLKNIPVTVLARHRKWQKIREEISRAEGLSSLRSDAKKHLQHPDIADLLSEPRNSFPRARSSEHIA